MKLKRGSTSVRRLIFIADSASTTGAGLANLTHSSSGLVAWYIAGDLSNDVQITLATATLGTFTSGGFVAVDNTNMPGWYEIGIPNAALDGGNEVAIHLRGAANMVPVNIYIELDAFDYQTATQPVNVTQFGGTSGTFASGRPDVTVASYASGQAPLQPTTAGRTLDVTATGAAGIDWANIENATATNQFSGSYIALQNNQNVNLNDGAITAAKFAANAITAAALASDAASEIGSATLTALGTGTWATAIPWNAAWDAEVQSECADAITAAGVMIGTYTAPDNATITLINAKTTNLPADPADASDIAAAFSTVNTTLATIAGYLDTEIAAIKARTDNLPTDPADQSAVEAAITAAANAIRGADNDTLKSLSDQIDGIDTGGGGGLTTEQAAALSRIDAKTALITGAKLSVAGAVSPGGDITLVIGDDRITAADAELIRTITDSGGALYARLNAAESIAFGAGRNGTADIITGTVTAAYASNVTTLTIEIDNTDISTDAIASEDYTYQIQRITDNGDCVVEVSGNLTLLDRYVSRA